MAAESGVVAEEAVATASVLAGAVELGVCSVSEAARVAVPLQYRLESWGLNSMLVPQFLLKQLEIGISCCEEEEREMDGIGKTDSRSMATDEHPQASLSQYAYLLTGLKQLKKALRSRMSELAPAGSFSPHDSTACLRWLGTAYRCHIGSLVPVPVVGSSGSSLRVGVGGDDGGETQNETETG